MKLSTLLAATSGAILLVAAPAAAQSTATPVSSHKGFFLGAHLNNSSVSSDDLFEDSENGGGAGIQLGWGFTPRLSLFGEATVARLSDSEGDAGFSHVDIGVRYAWTGARKWVPSLEAAFTGRGIASDDVELEPGVVGDLRITGAGFTLGGGVQYFFTPKFAVGAQLKWTGGKFDKYEFDGEEVDGLDADATSTRVNIGVTWYPMGAKR